ncbi:MAG TPA: Ig-like domain-containing protein, partial [Armatimonadota bacterium]|nr:Ig-like domain-containing protein [Armatimonadota bacterium]
MRMRTIIGLSLGFVLTLVLVGVLPLRAQDGPSFIIVQPQAAQKITGTALPIVIEFSCEEDAPVVRFESYLDSASLRWGRIRQPIARGHFRVEADLNEISVKPGPHTLYVKLYDSKGRVTQREQRIILEAPNTVRADSTPPRVRIVSPRDGQVISGKTDIKVDAVDDESGVKWVMVFINNKMRAYMNEAPYVLPWNPLDDKELLSAYVIRARAMDFFDNEGASLPVTVKLVQERTLIDDGAALQHPPADPVDAVIFPVTKLPTPSLGPGAEKWTSNLLRPAAALPGLSGELPLAQGFDRGGLPAETGALAVAVLPVKTLPGLAMTVFARGIAEIRQ